MNEWMNVILMKINEWWKINETEWINEKQN